jgi:biotin synthase
MATLTKLHIAEIYQQPYLDLVTQARNIHRQNFADEIELCQLISIKTGGCPEDCAYCSQSIKNSSEIKLNPLLPIEQVAKVVKDAQSNGVKRICMGGAYKTPPGSALAKMAEYIKLIKAAGLESCATLGSLTREQAQQLKDEGLDYYNHNLDTSPEHYANIVTTRTFAERLTTLTNVAAVGIKVCCGGILGLGETQADRISFIHALTQLPTAPYSIPINTLVRIPGTKLAQTPALDKLELVRVIATLRILFPQTMLRLSAGREELSELEQAMCFLSGANSIFFGDKLLTADNSAPLADSALLAKLGLAHD